MASERVATRSLLVFLCLVALLLLKGLSGAGRPDYGTALQRLLDNDIEAGERGQCLRAVLDGALTTKAPDRQLPGAMAAVLLGDEAHYAACCAQVAAGAATPGVASDADRLAVGGLGDPLLTMLVAAMLQERAHDAGAKAAYEHVAAHSRLWQAPFVSRLAKAGAARTP